MPMVHGPIIWVNDSDDEKVFRQLFLFYHKAIVYYARKRVSLSDAEEITADSFTKLWQLRHQYTHTKDAKSFLYTATHNACIDLLRKERTNLRRLQQMPVDTEPVIDREVIERAEVEAAVLQRLYENIMAMEGKRKEIGLLIFKEGRSNEEVGRLLGISPQVVRNWKWKILKKLRTFLGF
jgi:RNA polymerase sigma factor (sigma-70 family)